MTSRESEVQEGPSGAKSRWLAPNARSKEYTYRRAFDEMLLLTFQQALHRRTGPFEEGGNRPLVAREDLGMQGTKERRSVQRLPMLLSPWLSPNAYTIKNNLEHALNRRKTDFGFAL
jgi:hypothetical protein